jgi:hypothetical protein
VVTAVHFVGRQYVDQLASQLTTRAGDQDAHLARDRVSR